MLGSLFFLRHKFTSTNSGSNVNVYKGFLFSNVRELHKNYFTKSSTWKHIHNICHQPCHKNKTACNDSHKLLLWILLCSNGVWIKRLIEMQRWGLQCDMMTVWLMADLLYVWHQMPHWKEAMCRNPVPACSTSTETAGGSEWERYGSLTQNFQQSDIWWHELYK